MCFKKSLLLCSILTMILFLSYGCFQAAPDTDRDGVADKTDNCVNKPNPDQTDTDNDAFGDVCDNCPTTTFLRFSDQSDSDGDGVGDLCDNCINIKNANQADRDLDGIGDACSQEADILHYDLLSKASPDECYYGVGEANEYDPEGFDLEQCLSNDGQPKANEAYLWGMTKAGDNIFFSSYANAVCTNTNNAHPFDSTEIWVCERNKENNTNPVVERDFRPPSIYLYNTQTGIQKRLAVKAEDIPILNNTVGLRSAANQQGVAIVGGPSKERNQINLFAFNAQTGAPLGAKILPYHNIRRWIEAKGALYCGVSSLDTGGAVLKWVGNLNDPLKFEVVGQHISIGVAYLTFHDGRLFVSTWPNTDFIYLAKDLLINTSNPDANVDASIWMSPVIDDELNGGHADKWEKVWSIYDYEPDNLCAYLTGGGPLVSYNGWIYWSTMHIKNQATLYLGVKGITMNKEEKAYTEKGAYRATAVFRGRNLNNPATKTIELLYGEELLDSYTARDGWRKVPNRMNSVTRKPKYGHSGFGNLANNYMWAAEIYKGKLYFATMDDLGADLYCFPNTESEAKPVNVFGLGNMANFGIRNLVADDDYMYVGTANHYSLSTFTAEELLGINPEISHFMNTDYLPNLDAAGGWEFIRLESE